MSNDIPRAKVQQLAEELTGNLRATYDLIFDLRTKIEEMDRVDSMAALKARIELMMAQLERNLMMMYRDRIVGLLHDPEEADSLSDNH